MLLARLQLLTLVRSAGGFESPAALLCVSTRALSSIMMGINRGVLALLPTHFAVHGCMRSLPLSGVVLSMVFLDTIKTPCFLLPVFQSRRI